MENTNTMTGKPATEIVGVTETQEETFSEWCDKKVPFDKEKSKLAGENRAKEMTETKKYIIKCDDCKKTIRETGDVEESYAGGRCDKCKEESK